MSDLEEEEGLLREEEEIDEEGEGDSIEDSDEEEEEEEQVNEEDLKFIAPDDDESNEDEERVQGEIRKKKKKRKRQTLETLSDDDLDLIQENIGQKKKLKRKDYDLHNLFEKEFEDDLDDFVIRESDEEEEKVVVNLAAEMGISDSQWRDIDELFGTGDDYPHALELVEQKDVSLKDVYEPAEIQSKMLTDQDELIRLRDIPERYQTSSRMAIPDENEITIEANIITKTMMSRFSNVGESTLNQAITFILRFLRRDQFEVPFIYQHRRDYFDGIFELQDLWTIVDLDDNFIQVQEKKKQLMELIVQISSIDTSIESDEEVAHLVEKIVTIDDVNDTLAHIHLKYSTQIGQLSTTTNHRRVYKRAPWKILFDDAIQFGIKPFSKLFGIQMPQFVESVITRQSLHNPEDHYEAPTEAAIGFICPRFPTTESVLEAGRHLIAQEIAAHPQIRAFIRKVFQTDSVVSVRPTEKGKKEIEQHHPYHAFAYLKDKPVNRFTDGQFLQVLRGELDGLLEISIRVEEEEKLMSDIHKFICNDFSSEVAELWNHERKKVVDVAARELLFPQTVKWMKERLAAQASEMVSGKCQTVLERKIGMQPFQHGESDEAPIVMSISWGDGGKMPPTYVVILNDMGEMIDFTKLEKLHDREAKRDDCKTILGLLDRHKPNIVVVGGFKPNTSTMLMRILREDVMDIHRSQSDAHVPLMLVDDECARIYMNSKRGLAEFPESDYPPLIRYLVALGRYVQEPTLEYAGLCNHEEDIKNIRLDPLQHLISEEYISKAIERAFMNVVNRCGVDVNAAAAAVHLSHTLQFVSGLGPRKAQAIISKIIRSGGKLETRVDLVQKLGIGATVFLNCASFIRIREFHFTSRFMENSIDVLDDTRVHPEDYALARKMAADALDLEDAGVDDDENPSVHVKELMEGDVDKLNLLLLDDYAVELEKRLHAPKRVCLMDIKEELMNKYRDNRRRFEPPNAEQVFWMLTGESRDTLSEGTVVSVVVTRVKDRMIIVQLGSGVEGTIFVTNIDIPAYQADLSTLFHENQALMACVHQINYDRISVDLSLRQADIGNNLSRVRLDQFYDMEAQKRYAFSKKTMKKPQIEKQVRQIQHPYWQNINYKAAEKYLETRPRGEVVVRPSSSGKDHISVTYKVDEGIYQHIDVLEQQKPNEWTLGKRLVIGELVFSEIDQIIAEYVEPMTRKIAMLIDNPKYQRKSLSEMCTFYLNVVDYLADQVHILNRSCYGFIICTEKPGSFFLVYRHPTNSPRQETITVHPSGFEFRQKKFTDINELLAFFKHDEQQKSSQHRSRDPRRDYNNRGNDRRDPRGDPRDPRGDDRRRDYDNDRDRRGSGRYDNSYGSRGY